MKVHFSDMTPPEDFARVADIVDDSVVYYAIKLDPKKPVTAKLGGGHWHPDSRMGHRRQQQYAKRNELGLYGRAQNPRYRAPG